MNDPSRTGPSGGAPQERLQDSKERAVDAAQDAAQKVRNVAEDRYEDAKDAVQARVAEARDIAESKIAQARNVAGSKVAEAREAAQDRAEQGVSHAASGLKTTAHRLRDVADELDGNDRWLGATLERAAETADRAGEYLSGNRLGDIVDDAQDLARRSPATFMGGAAALGFALARLGKVTVDRATGPSSSRSTRHGYVDSRGAAGSHAGRTHSASDKNRAGMASGGADGRAMASTSAPTPSGLNTGTASPTTASQPVTRPTDGRDLNPVQSTPLHRSQT